jgi:hypothetical protein
MKNIYTTPTGSILYWNSGTLIITPVGRQPIILKSGSTRTHTPDAREAQIIRCKGGDPATTRVMCTLFFSLETAAWIDAHAEEFQAAIDAAAAARAADPAVREQDRIEGLYAEAEQHKDMDPGLYFSMRADAAAALAAWRVAYPEAARDERRASLLRRAAHERELASGAQFYDADGWLDAAAREARSAEFIAKAEALEAEAREL